MLFFLVNKSDYTILTSVKVVATGLNQYVQVSSNKALQLEGIEPIPAEVQRYSAYLEYTNEKPNCIIVDIDNKVVSTSSDKTPDSSVPTDSKGENTDKVNTSTNKDNDSDLVTAKSVALDNLSKSGLHNNTINSIKSSIESAKSIEEIDAINANIAKQSLIKCAEKATNQINKMNLDKDTTASYIDKIQSADNIESIQAILDDIKKQIK